MEFLLDVLQAQVSCIFIVILHVNPTGFKESTEVEKCILYFKSVLLKKINKKLISIVTVVSKHYHVDVYPAKVSVGNTAILTCVIPDEVKEHVTVTSWSRDETILLPGFNMGKLNLNLICLLFRYIALMVLNNCRQNIDQRPLINLVLHELLSVWGSLVEGRY